MCKGPVGPCYRDVVWEVIMEASFGGFTPRKHTTACLMEVVYGCSSKTMTWYYLIWFVRFNCWRCGFSKRGGMDGGGGYISEHGRQDDSMGLRHMWVGFDYIWLYLKTLFKYFFKRRMTSTEVWFAVSGNQHVLFIALCLMFSHVFLYLSVFAAFVPIPSMNFNKVSPSHRIHPDIRELCDQFYVEERHVEKLNELMKALLINVLGWTSPMPCRFGGCSNDWWITSKQTM